MASKDSAKTVPSATKIPPVPETILKRRKRNADLATKSKQHAIKVKKARTIKRKTFFKKAEKYVNEYRKMEKNLILNRREAKMHGNFFVPGEPKLALVIRIRGINQMSPKPRKILQLLRLRQINNATFVKLTGATSAMLKIVEPYITYGYPNLKTVRELVYKRGFGRVHKQRKGLTDNSIIEQQLGKFGIICVEDLIHEIYTVGPHFKEANAFLWTFKLSPPRGGWSKVTNGVTEGGDFGNRETTINALVHRMI